MPILPENKKRYPADWQLRSKFIRVFRARNACEWCHAANGKPHPVTGSKVVLTVAHVFDNRPEACAFLNLAALCQLCHNRHDAKERALRRRIRLEKSSGQLCFLFLQDHCNPASNALPIDQTVDIALSCAPELIKPASQAIARHN